MRYHTCYGINMGPRVHDLELKHIVDIMLEVNAGAYSFEAANPRHEHEWQVWEDVKLPDGKVLIPGVITHASNLVEHPELIAQRIGRFAEVVGRENVIAGADCGFASFADARARCTRPWCGRSCAALGQGARLASKELWGRAMKFGYFTLSDNHFVGNTRPANQLIAEILDQAVYAEAVGMHSAWIGEHHFSTLGVLSCPDLVLAQVAARTKSIRLAPAVTVLPLHHPIRVAEQWATLDMLSGGRVDFAAGRGYDRREYGPLEVSFDDNQAIFEEGLEIVRRLWASDDAGVAPRRALQL